MSCSTPLPKSPDRIAQPHSRSGPRPCPWVPVASPPLITGARLAFALLYRSLLLSMTLTHHYTGSPLRDSGQHHYCYIAFRLRSIRLAFTFPASRNDKAPTFPPGLFLFFMPPLKVKAAYQSRLKYDAFNLLLQYSAAKMSIFVPNVFLLRKAMHHDQAD